MTFSALALLGGTLACLPLLAATHGNRHTSTKAAMEKSALTPQVHVGDRFGDLFSRTVAYQIPGFDDVVQRASGNADYIVSEATPTALRFTTTGRYDGAPAFQGTTEIRDNGATTCWNAQCSPTLDGSGLLYNARLWGAPPAFLKRGMTWVVNITEPWELGPPGTEHVTVLAFDPDLRQITLEREGTGDGYFDSDSHQLRLRKGTDTTTADVTPGRAHWIGRATFERGIVVSDELMVERTLTLTSKQWGALPATQREYILLNATPPSAN